MKLIWKWLTVFSLLHRTTLKRILRLVGFFFKFFKRTWIMDDKVIDWLVMKFGFLAWSKNSLRNMQEGGEKGDKKHVGAGTGKMKTGINRYSSERARKLNLNLRSNVPFLLTRKAHRLWKYRIVRAEKRATLDFRLVVSENFQNAGQYVPTMRRCLW